MFNIFSTISEPEFTKLFNDRDFNPPIRDVGFSEEFDSAIEVVRETLLRHVAEDEFVIHEYHNSSRFIDVAFNSENYMSKTLIEDIHKCLENMVNAWMVCLWEACFIFVTPDKIFGFDPTNENASFAKLKK